MTAKIMIVEDDSLTASYIQSMLEDLGYDVVGVESSGEDAIANFIENKPDLVLMDIQLKGGLDGIETAYEIHRRFKAPVVYLTAHSDTATLERAKMTEPFGYIVKPFKERELVSNIEIALHKHKVEEKIKQMAYYDPLTGLPNRTLLFERLGHDMSLSKRLNKMMAVLLLDLDGFKKINDKMGHDAGDIILRNVSERLINCIRESDTAARIGGDEFVIIYTNLSCPSEVAILASKIIVSIGKPYLIKNIYCSLGVSIGVSIFPDDGSDVSTLLKKADMAMYRAKDKGKNNFQFYSNAFESYLDKTGFCLNLKVVLNIMINFILRHSGKWDHHAWLELLEEFILQRKIINRTLEPFIGGVLESIKSIYEIAGENADKIVPEVCNEIESFVQMNQGTWINDELLQLYNIPAINSIISKAGNNHSILNLLESMKSLYISLCL